MQNENYIDQSVWDLNYNVFNGSPNKEAFNVIKTKTYNTTLGSVLVDIIGESHCINFMIGDQNITEVLACVIPRSNSMLLSASGEDIFDQGFILEEKSLKYEFQAQKVVLDGSDQCLVSFEAFYNDAEKHSQAVEHIFNMPVHYAYEAKTAIALEENNGVIQIQTLHAYPNEDIGVVTMTTVKKVFDNVQ